MPQDKKQFQLEASVTGLRQLNQHNFILTLAAPLLAQNAVPGQFVNVSAGQFLRRPFGIMARDKGLGQISLGIQIQGEGTKWLARRQIGDQISLLGPLGHGFRLAGYKRIITVGGGSGVYPLFFVQQVCAEQAIEAIAVCGYRTKADSLLESEYSDLGCRTLFAAQAGGLEVAGHAGQALEQLLSNLPDLAGTAVLTCGPRPMMEKVAQIARQHGLACQVSLEERMACGVGVCLACVCQTKSGYQRCCVEGPVFMAEDVQW